MKKEVQIGAYYFIDYYKKNLNEFLNIINDFNTVICFDLEDSIQDVYSIQGTAEKKKYFRNFLFSFFNDSFNQDNIKLGLRINSLFTAENDLDIKFLSQVSGRAGFDSIFLTKVESNKDIVEFEKKLNENNIKCTEIIAVIETIKGFRNIQEIISAGSAGFRKIAFGHCDYNLDINNFPFKHQNSRTYWNWIEQIAYEIKNYGNDKIEFINSPYLELENDTGFGKMLTNLIYFFGERIFQITLTRKQSNICNIFKDIKPVNNIFTEDEDEKCKEVYAKHIIREFNNYHVRNSFAVTGVKRLLISPHEYKAALKYLSSNSHGH